MKIFISLLCLTFLLIGRQATAGCNFSPSSSFPLSGTLYYSSPVLDSMTISVPAGASVGQVIYQQNVDIKDASKYQISCSETADFYFKYDYGSTPKPISSYGFQVYETGVSGIGVQFVMNETIVFPYTSSPMGGCTNTTKCDRKSTNWWYSGQIRFIKTAQNITAGTISGHDIPKMQILVGQLTSMLLLQEVSFSGTLTVTAPTCNITTASQAMTVPMGQYDIGDFTAKGTGTAWKDSSIKLSGCGQFYGNTSNSIATFDGTTTTATGTLANNTWSLTLSPYSSIIDATTGIMDINDDPLRANGVGIQLSTTQSTSGLINLNNAVTGALPKDGSSNITVPLYARYIQTGNSVSAGKANGKLMYTITYQ